MTDAEPDELAALLQHHDYGTSGDVEVDWIQTHISHVFLVGDRVYKLRKAVRQPFLDFSTRALRNADCEREVALNRRLAPDVYLGIVSVARDGEGVCLGPLGDGVDRPDREHLVVMRRLEAGRDALALLERSQLEPTHLEAIAERLAVFHETAGLGRPAPWTPEAWLERIARPTRECVDALRESDLLETSRVDRLEAAVADRGEALAPCFEARRQAGCAIDAHGDLHLDHVWFEVGRDDPLMIDCLEFDEALRRIDRASEIAFLAMDLRYRGETDYSEYLLSCFAAETDDYDLFAVVDYYSAYRALVRAKVAALAVGQATIAEEQRKKARGSVERHVLLAEDRLDPPAEPGVVVLCGTVGTGKSTVARTLAQTGGGIQITADRVRKARAGLAATDRTGAAPDEGIYSSAQTEAVYQGLLERAAPVVESGRTAILDASFTRRVHRDAARAWARERGLPIRLVEVRCDVEVARERLERRQRAGLDPSDAGPDFLPISLERFEAPDEWPEASREAVWTDREGAA